MASANSNTIVIDVYADTICPWCYVGKKYFDQAIASSKNKYTFEIKWHPYVIDPKAPVKKPVLKMDFYSDVFGSRYCMLQMKFEKIFEDLGMSYETEGKTGSSVESHRLIHFAGQTCPEKQHQLVEEIYYGYFVQGKFIRDRDFLIEAATKAGVEGAAEFLADPENGLKEVNEEIQRNREDILSIIRVPHFKMNNGNSYVTGPKLPEHFLKAFEAAIPKIPRSVSMASNAKRKHVLIDVYADTICPWCYVGKKYFDQAIASSNDQYNFEIKWHHYVINPKASVKKPVRKGEFYSNQYGNRYCQLQMKLEKIFEDLGMNYDRDGKTGSSVESHRLLHFTGQTCPEKQHQLVEEIFYGYFVQGKFIRDRDFLVEAATKAGVEGAAEFLADPENGLKEVNEEIQRNRGDYASFVRVPHFEMNNGKSHLTGPKLPEHFLKAFEAAVSD